MIGPRPRGGDWLADEVAAWRKAGVDVVVSLLTPEENAEFDITGERAACLAAGTDFVSFPIPDRGVPASRAAALDLLRPLGGDLAGGKTVAVHCRQGIGRSALIAAGLLVTAGVEPDAAIQSVAQVRGRPVPETAEQREWITSLTRPSRQIAAAHSASKG
jgi:protein-tyrosine phosphatase